MRSKRIALIAAFTIGVSALLSIVTLVPAGAATRTLTGWYYADQNPDGSCPAPNFLQGNVAPNIGNFILGLQNGDTGQLEANKCYRTDTQVAINGRQGITFDGRGSTLVSTDPNPPSGFAHLKIQGGSVGVLVRNLKIVGTHTMNGYDSTRASQHGVQIIGNGFITLDNLTIDHVYGDYIHLQKDNSTSPAQWPTFISITNGHFGQNSTGTSGAGRQGLAIIAALDVTVTGNVFGNNARSAIDIEPNGSGDTVRDVTIDGNTFLPNGLNWFSNIGNAEATIDTVTVTNNTLYRSMAVDAIDQTIGSIDTSNQNTFQRYLYTFSGNTQAAGTADGTGGCDDMPGNALRFNGIWGLRVDSNLIRIDTDHQCQYLVRASAVNARITNNIMSNDVVWPTVLPASVPLNYGGKYIVGVYVQKASTQPKESIVCERANHAPDSAHNAPITPAGTALDGKYYIAARTWTPPNIPAACSGY